MLLIIHLLLHSILGGLLGLSAKHPQSKNAQRPVPGPLLWGSVYVDLLALAPVVAYQLRLWPAYALSYAYDPLLYGELYRYVPALCLGTLIALPATLAAALYASAALASHGRRAAAWGLVFALSAAAGALLYALRDSWLTIADFGSFWRGGGTPIYQYLHARLMLLAYSLALVATLVVRKTQQRRDS